MLNAVFLGLYALSVGDFYAPDGLGLHEILYIPSMVVCLLLSPVAGGVQFLYFACRFGKTRDKHYVRHLYAALLTGLCWAVMLALVSGGFYITV